MGAAGACVAVQWLVLLVADWVGGLRSQLLLVAAMLLYAAVISASGAILMSGRDLRRPHSLRVVLVALAVLVFELLLVVRPPLWDWRQ